MRFGSTARVLAKCMLKYYRISEWGRPDCLPCGKRCPTAWGVLIAFAMSRHAAGNDFRTWTHEGCGWVGRAGGSQKALEATAATWTEGDKATCKLLHLSGILGYDFVLQLLRPFQDRSLSWAECHDGRWMVLPRPAASWQAQTGQVQQSRTQTHNPVFFEKHSYNRSITMNPGETGRGDS